MIGLTWIYFFVFLALFMTDYIGTKFYTDEDNYGLFYNFDLPYSALYQELELYTILGISGACFAAYCVAILLLKKVKVSIGERLN